MLVVGSKVDLWKERCFEYHQQPSTISTTLLGDVFFKKKSPPKKQPENHRKVTCCLKKSRAKSPTETPSFSSPFTYEEYLRCAFEHLSVCHLVHCLNWDWKMGKSRKSPRYEGSKGRLYIYVHEWLMFLVYVGIMYHTLILCILQSSLLTHEILPKEFPPSK